MLYDFDKPVRFEDAKEAIIADIKSIDHADGPGCVCFAGAGCTIEDYGDWSKLLNGLTDAVAVDAVEKESLKDSCYKTWAENLFNKNRPLCLRILQEEFTKKVPISPCCSALAKIKFFGFCTTNYDLILLRALSDSDSPPRAATYPVLNPFSMNARTVFHLHGGPDPNVPDWQSLYADGLIFTKSSYSEAYGNEDLPLRDQPPSAFILRSFLTHLFLHKHVLFVGCGLRDDEEYSGILKSAQLTHQTLLSNGYKGIRSSPTRKWALVPEGKAPTETTINAGIKLVTYTVDPLKKPHRRHDNLPLALEELSGSKGFIPQYQGVTADPAGGEL